MKNKYLYLGYGIDIGQKMTYKELKITLTAEIAEKNPDIFIKQFSTIDALGKQLLEDKDGIFWLKMKTIEPRLYWLKILKMLADANNKTKKAEDKAHFIWYDRYADEVKIAGHTSVRYNMIYFNSGTDAKQAIALLGHNVKYVV